MNYNDFFKINMDSNIWILMIRFEKSTLDNKKQKSNLKIIVITCWVEVQNLNRNARRSVDDSECCKRLKFFKYSKLFQDSVIQMTKMWYLPNWPKIKCGKLRKF